MKIFPDNSSAKQISGSTSKLTKWGHFKRLVASLILCFGLGLIFWGFRPVSDIFAQGTATLAFTKSFAGNSSALTIASGQEFVYYLAYSCSVSGVGNCENVVITDTLVTPLEYRSVTGLPAGATVDTTNSPTVVIDLGDVPDGDTRVLQLRVRFPPGTEPGLIVSNSATINADNGDPVTTDSVDATVTGQFEMVSSKTIVNDIDDRVIGTEFATNYKILICSPDEIGGVRLTSPVITDTLPAGATYISADPAPTAVSGSNLTWTSTSAGGNLPDVIEVGGCFITEVVVSFPAGTFTATDVVTNTARVTGSPEFGPPFSYDSGPIGRTDTLINPYYGGDFAKTSTSSSTYYEVGKTEELAGGAVAYTLSYQNKGTALIEDAVVTDTIPASHTVDIISIGVISDPVRLSYQSNETSGWQVVGSYLTSTLVTSASLGLSPTDMVTALRWEIGAVPIGQAPWNDLPTWSGGFSAILDPALAASQTLQNCAQVGASWDDQGTPTGVNGADCSNVTVIDQRAIPRTTKSVSDNSILPEDVVTFTLRALNENVAHNVVDAPIVLADLLPPEFEIVVADASDPSGYRAATITDTTWYTFSSTDAGASVPTATLTLSGTQYLVTWEWGAPYQQPPGTELVVNFAARTPKGTPPGTLNNRSFSLWEPITTNPLPCSGSRIYTDTLDIDNDGNTTETGCQSASTPVQVQVFLAMSSEKFVLGERDAGWNKDGLTIPGGDVDYRMILTNTSNVTVTNLVAYDILPFVGDKGVIDGKARDSEWRPNLQAPITGPVGVPLTVYYSRATNPCHPEVKSKNPGCINDWSTSPPTDITSVQALKFEFCQAGTCLELGPETENSAGGRVELTWEMVAPDDAPYDPARAWNSFGYTAEQKDGVQLALPPAEPNKVGIRLEAADPNLVSLGNYVWFDVYGQQNDGIQQPEEIGINGVRIELWNGNGTPADIDGDGQADYRITGLDANGNPGYYLFTDLPLSSTYTLRFFPPLTYTINGFEYSIPYTTSLSNQGGNDALDSDGQSYGTSITHGTYIETGLLTTTLVLTSDLTWDQGLWLPTDYGDAPGSYPTAAISQTNPFSAARHVIIPGLYLGSGVDGELDGQPNSDAWGDDSDDGNDDEDGVLFDTYLGTAAEPSALMTLGQSETITLTAAVPLGQVGYLNAWLDFNSDGDWDDPGEQIATDRSTSSGTFSLTVAVPAGATPGKTYARFRFSTETGLTPYGPARDGEVEDYQIQLLPQSKQVKSIVATSAGHTSGSNLTIGETVTYRLVVSIPEGVMTNFKIRDNLPARLQVVSNTVTTSFTATTSVVSSTFAVNGGPFGSGTDPIFDFGTLTNNDSDIDREFVVVEFQAVVLDVSGNQDGTNRQNTFTVTYDNNYNVTSNQVRIDLVEPVLSISKVLLTPLPDPLDAGTVITYQVVISHAANSHADAFDLLITDTLPSQLSNANLVGVSASGITAPNADLTGNVLRLPDSGTFDLPQGAVVTATFNAEVDNSAIPGQVISNTAGLIWSTLDGPDPNERDDGLGTPDGSNQLDGGAVDDYEVEDTAAFSVDGATLVKDMVGTSAAHTVATDVTIGELITYSLAITLPDGTVPSLQIIDDLPPGLAYVTNTVSVDTSNFNGTVPPPSATSPGGSGDDVTIDFGPITINPDAGLTNNRFVVQLQSLVLDEAGNDGLPPGQTDLVNRATVQVGSQPPIASNPFTTTVVEPQMVITKNIVSAEAVAGEVIIINLSVHNSGSADAFEVIVEDPLPNATFVVFSEGTTPAGFSYSTVPNGANTIVRYTGGNIAVNQTLDFSFQAQLTSPVTKNLVHTNVATVTQVTTLPGANPDERDEPDVSDDDSLTLIALTLGNQVWFDANNNGLLDGGESGFDGVVVNLLDSSGLLITDTISGLPITTTTSGGGIYTFTNLVAGDYIVELDAANFGVGQVLEHHFSSTGHSDPNNDFDSDDNGVDDGNPAANGLQSLPITLTYYGETLGDEDGDGDSNSNLTVDFGLVLPDYGDAPNSYATINASNGGRHLISPSLYLGAAVDVESDGQPNVSANGDDIANSNGVNTPADDEDGVQFSTIVLGQTATLTVTTMGGGFLDAWLDFGADGTWTEAIDHICSSRALISGTNIITFNVPITASLSNATYARFRLSSAGGLSPTGLAADGEIEDYIVSLTARDYGDLPDSYNTTNAAGGAYHTISAGLYLGGRVDSEADGQPSPEANADDSTTTGPGLPSSGGDDEDGITFDTPLIPGEVATITVQAVGSGNLSGWIDFNGDGGFDPGERVFTNTAILSGTTSLSFNVPLGSTPDDTGVRFRYTGDSLASQADPASDGEVEDYLVPVVRLDYGDLPAVYPTTNGNNPARHIILDSNNPTLGSLVDAETDGTPSVDADGDDFDIPKNDDEDGVDFSRDFFPGETTVVTVSALTTGTLNAWIDWNGDGDFNDGGEQIAVDQTINAGTSLPLTVNVPLTATQGILAYSRFRFSSDIGLNPNGLASDGEVEDYAMPLRPLDWGDLPNDGGGPLPDYPTQNSDDGARHAIIRGNNPILGSRVDAEGDGQPAAGADADDLTNGALNEGGAGDDEDGVVIPPLVPGTTVTVTVTYSNPTGSPAYLNGWLDIDGNGTLDQIASDTAVSPNSSGTIDIPVNIPLSASEGTVYSRFRLSTESGLGLTGFAADGEVEDHATLLAHLDWGDLPNDGAGPLPDYPTQQVDDGPRHIILTANNPTLGAVVDSEANGQPSVGADGDDLNTDDEDGVTFSGPLVPGEVMTVTVTASAAADGLLNGWIDFNGNGVLDDPGEQISLNQAITAGSTIQIPVNVPLSTRQGITTYARFRFSSDSDLQPTGLAGDGEVEDYALNTMRLDYGDLPNDGPGGDPDFPVLYADDGPRHIIDPVANPVLGTIVDNESNGQPSVSANGDDLNGDDEDGVTFSGYFMPGQTITLTVTANNPTAGNTFLNGWLDLDGDGDLDQIATDMVVPPGANTLVLTVTIPATATVSDLYSRFRISSEAGLQPTGLASDGEVEDYIITLQPALPNLAINKVASEVRIAPNSGLITYTIRITNTGNVPLKPVRLIDTMQAGIIFIPGTANPPLDSQNGQVLVWNDLSAGNGLAPGDTLEVTLGATLTSTIGLYRNIVVSEGTHPVTSTTATDEEPVVVEDPTISLDKELAAPGVVGEFITFTIRFTNTGPSVLTNLPLFDSFSGPIEYVRGTPPADQVDNVNGQLAWNNLVDDFGPLAPDQMVTIQTVFHLTTTGTEFSMTNRASSSGGLDTNGNPTNDDDDQVDLSNVPTAVDLLYFRSRQTGTWVELEWATAVEYDNFGFALLRSETGNLADAVEIAFVEGRGLGTVQGQEYSYSDDTTEAGRSYTYWLVDIDFDGLRTIHESLASNITITSLGSNRLYLPLIFR